MATYSGAPSFEYFYVNFANVSGTGINLYTCMPGEQVAVMYSTATRTGPNLGTILDIISIYQPQAIDSSGNYGFTFNGISVVPAGSDGGLSNSLITGVFEDPFVGGGRSQFIAHQDYRVLVQIRGSGPFGLPVGYNSTFTGRALLKRYRSL
jgi:hypothetical protein